jgi:hypothetical protein
MDRIFWVLAIAATTFNAYTWRFKSPIAIKILTAISLAGGITAMYLMWTMQPLAR